MMYIPEVLPAQVTDKVLICLRHMGEMVIHLELEFEERLDAERLARALDLVLDAEPVLGCRFVTDRLRVHWARLPRERRQNFTVAASSEEYEAFKLQPINAETRPQLRGCLWSAPEGDRLLLKISHYAADAGGCKEAAAALAGIYNRLEREPGYLPEPNLAGSRGIWQALRRIPWYYYPKIYLNYLLNQPRISAPIATLGLPLAVERREEPFFIARHLPAERVGELAAYGRERQATLNDLLLAALFRALIRLAEWDGKTRLRLLHTADLRRHYLPGGRAEGICNLSALEYVFLGTDPGADFDATLARVAEQTRRRKNNWIGLNDYIAMMPTLALLPARWSARFFARVWDFLLVRGGLRNGMTNMGPIPPESATFGRPARRAWLIAPPMFPPLFAFGLTGYAGSLTLTGGSFAPPETRGYLEAYTDALLAELPEGEIGS